MTNNEVKEFCEKHCLTIDQFYGREVIEGSLDLDSITEIPECFNPTVGCNLYLNSVLELPEGFNPTVGSSLYLKSVLELPEGFNPTVGGCLYLDSVTELPKGFNPTVGGSLDLDSVLELPEGFNPTVGWNLYLISINETPNGFNPTVGGSIYYNNTYKDINHDLPILSWQDGKYIKVDGIFCEVLHKKDNIFKCKDLDREKYFYVVSDGNDTYAHGNTLKEAQLDLSFKLSERNIDGYKNLTLDSVLEHDEAVICYRVITGTCRFGTNNFLDNVLGENSKESYTINEIIQLTENQYGNVKFKEFFNV